MPAHKVTTAEMRKRIIKASREMKGLTQAQAGKKLGLKQSDYSRWENTYVSDMVDKLKDFCSVTGADIMDLWRI